MRKLSPPRNCATGVQAARRRPGAVGAATAAGWRRISMYQKLPRQNYKHGSEADERTDGACSNHLFLSKHELSIARLTGAQNQKCPPRSSAPANASAFRPARVPIRPRRRSRRRTAGGGCQGGPPTQAARGASHASGLGAAPVRGGGARRWARCGRIHGGGDVPARGANAPDSSAGAMMRR